jgi:TonB family protein
MLLALAASASVHLWLAGAPSGATRATMPFPVHGIEVRLAAADRAVSRPEPEEVTPGPQRTERVPGEVGAQPATVPAARKFDARASVRPATSASPTPAPAPETPRAVQRASDPVYYAARDLDVYPVPLAPLQFRYPAHLSGERAGGEVLVRLLLDETGSVDEATVIAAQRAEPFDEYARAILAAARFSPGRRDGRAVKSQLTVRVSVEPAVHTDALR